MVKKNDQNLQEEQFIAEEQRKVAELKKAERRHIFLAKEIDKQLHTATRQRRNIVPKVDRLHNYLTNKFSWYLKWDGNRFSSLTHLLTLASYILIVGFSLFSGAMQAIKIDPAHMTKADMQTNDLVYAPVDRSDVKDDSKTSMVAKNASDVYEAKDGEKEIIAARTENFKKFDLGNNKYRVTGSTGPIHFKYDNKDENETYKEIDLTIHETKNQPWDYEMKQNSYQVRVWNSRKVENQEFYYIAQFWKDKKYFEITPSELVWQNDSGEMQIISQPVAGIKPVIDNDNYTITWPDAFGPGIDYRYNLSPEKFFKTLIIRDPQSLPEATIGKDGLKLKLIMSVKWPRNLVPADQTLKQIYPNGLGDASSIVEEVANGGGKAKKEKKADAQIKTPQDMLFTDLNNQPVWNLQVPKGWDSSEAKKEINLEQEFGQYGSEVYLSVSTKYSSLTDDFAKYPVYLDTSITQEQVGASLDDVRRAWSSDIWSTNDWMVSGSSGVGNVKEGSAVRFTTVPIPSGVTVSAATLGFYGAALSQAADSTNIKTKIRAQAADNPGTFSNQADFDARFPSSVTTAYTLWDSFPAVTDKVLFTSPDIANVVQELVNRAGWTSNNSMVFFWDDYDGRSTVGNRRLAYSYDNAAANAPVFNATYYTPSAGGGTISGTCKQNDRTTNCADGETIKVAVNGTLQAGTGTTASGAWSVTLTGTLNYTDVVTVFVDGVADTNEAVAVTKLGAEPATTSGVVLYERQLTLGGTRAHTITNSDIAQYDNSVSGDEDIFVEVDSSSNLLLPQTGTSSTTDQTLYVMTNATYQPASAGGKTIATPKLFINTNGTVTADSNTFDISADTTPVTFTGTFTAGTSTFKYSASSNNVTTALGSYYNLELGTTSDSSTGRTFTLGGATTVSNVLTVGNASSTNSDAFSASSYTLTLSGSGTPFVITSKGSFTYATSTVNYIGSSSTNVSALTYYNLGVGTTSDTGTAVTYSLAGDTTVNTTLTVGNASSTNTDTLAIAGYTLTVAGGTNTFTLTSKGTFTTTTGTVNYTCITANANIAAGTYYNLGVGTTSDANAARTFTMAGSVTVNNTITVGNASSTNSDIFSTGASAYTLTLAASGTTAWNVTAKGSTTLSGSSTVNYIGTSATTVRATTYYSLGVGTTSDTGAGVTYTMGGASTIANLVTVGNASSTNTDTLALSSYKMTITKTAAYPFTVTAKGTIDAGTSEVEYYADGNMNISPSTTITYYNLTVDSVLTADRTLTTNGAISVSNNMTFFPYGASNPRTNTLTLAGNLTVTGTLRVEGSGTGRPVIQTSTSNYAVTAGTLNIATGGNIFSNNSTLTCNGNATVAGEIAMMATGNLAVTGNLTVSGKVSGGTVTLQKTNDASATLTTGGTKFNNLTINASGSTYTLQDDLNVYGDLTLTAGTLDVGASNKSINLAGSWVNNGGTFNARAGTVTYSDYQTSKSITANGQSFYNLTISGNNPTFSTSMMHMEGSNNGATFTDENGSNVWSASGAAVTSTTQKKYGSTAYYGNAGASDYISTTSNLSNFQFGTTNTPDFTIESWIYLNEAVGSQRVIAGMGNGTASWSTTAGHHWILYITSAGKLCFQYNQAGSAATLTATNAISATTWTHIAVVRAGGYLKLYVGGVEQASGAAPTYMTLPSGSGTPIMKVGTDAANDTPWKGYIDEFRVVKGVGIYQGAFTPPAAVFACANTISGAATITGNYSQTSGAVTAPAAGSAFNVAGNFLASGGTFTHNSGTITLNGSGAQSLDGTAGNFNNLTITNSSGTVTQTGPINAAGTVTIPASGTLDSSTFNITAGTMSNLGTWKLSGDQSVTVTNPDTTHGTVIYTGYGGGAMAAGNSYNNLTLAPNRSYTTGYKRPVIIANTSGSTLTDYPVQVTLSSSNFSFASSTSDGKDLRVYDSTDNSALNFWIESWNQAGQTGTVWVKIPSIPTTGATIYLHYGDSSLTTASNGTNTFDFFDDFSSGSVDTNKWTQQNSAGGSVAQSNGLATFTANGTSDYAWLHTKNTYTYPMNFESKLSGNTTNGIPRLGESTGATLKANGNFYNAYDMDWYGGNLRMVTDSSGASGVVTQSTVALNTGIWKMLWLRTGSEKGSDGNTNLTGADLGQTIGNYYGYLGIAATNAGTVSWDWARMRKYAVTEPSASVGAESSSTISYKPSGNMTINGNFTLTGGTIDANGQNIDLKGNWLNNGGSYTPGSQSVTLSGNQAQSVTCNGTDAGKAFYDLTVTNSHASGVTFADSCTVSGTFTDITNSSKLTFHAGSTYSFANININGNSVDSRIVLASSAASVWYFNVANALPAASYVDVSYSDASGSAARIDASVGSNDGDHNINWDFSGAPAVTVTISGTVYTQEDKGANIGDNKTIALSINGGTATTVETTSGGVFSFSSVTIAANQTAAVFISGETEKGSLITQAIDENTNITGLELYTGNVVLSHQTAGPMTNTLLATADNVNNSDLRVSVDGSNVATFTSTMWVPTGKTYTPGAAVVATSVNIDGTFTASSNNLTVSGSWDANSGTVSTSGTVTFNASSGTASIGSGGQSFNNLVINDNSGSATFQITTALDVNGTFTLTDGVLDLDTNDPTVNIAGNVSITGGSITKSSANSLVTFDGDMSYTNSAGSNLGDIQIGHSPDTTTLASDLSCDSLTIDASDSLITAGYNITNAGNLTIGSSATLNATTSGGRNSTISVGGNWSNSGTFTASTSTVTFTATDTGHTILDGGSNWNHVTFNGSGGGWSFSDSTTMSGDLTMTAGTLSGTNDITVNGGDATGNATINLTGGTFLLDGVGNFGGTTNWTFYNLTFGDTSGTATSTKTSSNQITATNVLTIATNQTLDAGDDTWVLSGSSTPLVVNGTFAQNTSTFSYTGASATNITGTTYYNLTLDHTGTTFTSAANTTVTHVFTITSGTYNGSDDTLTLSGTGTPFVNNGTFDGGTGTVKYTGQGTTTVAAANYYNLQTVPSDPNAPVGKGIDLGGSTAKIAAATNSALNISTNLTLEAWVYMDAANTNAGVIYKGSLSSEQGEYAMLIGNGSASKIVFRLNKSITEGSGQATSATTLNSGTLYHIACTYDGSNMRIWINGALDQTKGYSTTITNTNVGLTVGNYYDGNYSFNGKIYASRISNAVRYTDTFTPSKSWSNDSSTAVLWNYEEGTGSSVNDDSSNNIDGTASGSYTWADYPSSGGGGWTVSSAGDSSYNGTYTESGTHNGQPSYTNGSRWLFYNFAMMDSSYEWALSTSASDCGDPYMCLAYYQYPGNTSPNASSWYAGDGYSGTPSFAAYSSAFNYTLASGTFNISGSLTNGDGTQPESLTATTNDPILNIDGSFTNAAGSTFIASDSAAFSIASDLILDTTSTFTHSSGTLTLDGQGSQTITANGTGAGHTLNNLTITNASTAGVSLADSLTLAGTFTDTTASSKVTFHSGSTYAFNAININGQATGTRITLTSSTGGSAWNLNITASSPTASYVSVKDSNANKDIDATTGGYDATGNTHWLFPVTVYVSGTVYTAENKSTNLGANKTVALSINGGTVATDETDSSGIFRFDDVTLASNDPITIFLSGETEKAVLVTIAANGTSAISSLEMFTNRIVLTHASSGPISNSVLATADNACTSDCLFSVDGSSVATFTSGNEVYIPSGKTYTPGGAVILDDLEIDGTLTLASNAATVHGSWDSADGQFTTNGTVTFDASSGMETLNSGGTGGSGGWTVSSAGDSSYNGTYTASGTHNGQSSYTNGSRWLFYSSIMMPEPGYAWEMYSSVSDCGDPYMCSAYYQYPGSTSPTGSWYAGMDYSGTPSLSEAPSGGGAFTNLTKSGGGTLQLADDIDIDGTLSIGSSTTFDINGKDFALATLSNDGTLKLQGGETATVTTMDTDSGTVEYSGASTYSSLLLGDTYSNLKINGSGTWSLDNNLAVSGVLDIAAGSLDALTYTVTLSGSGTPFVISGTFHEGASTFVYTSSSSTNIAATTFNNLTLNHTGTTFTAGGDISINGTMTIQAGTFDASSRTLTLNAGGTPLVNSGVFTASTSTVKYAGPGDTNIADLTYYNMIFDSASTGVRKPITITNSSGSNLTDYQIKVSLTSSNFDFGDSTLDGHDIRFKDSNGSTNLNYWIESWDSVGQKATIWVKVPSIPTDGATIYMHYGDGGLAAASNGVATFDLFDDFDNLNSWTQEGTSISVSNSVVTLDNNGGTAPAISRTFNISSPFTAEAKYQRATSYRNRMYLTTSSATGSPTGSDYGDFGQIYWQGEWTGTTLSANTWYTTRWYNTPSNYTWQFIDSAGNTTITRSTGSAISNLTKLTFTGTESTDSDLKFDWVRIRKYASAEPSVSVGAEASAAGSYSFTGNSTVNNDLTTTSGTLKGSSRNITLKGDWLNNATFVKETSTLTLAGTGAQQITGGGDAFNNILVSNTAAAVSQSDAVTISGTLTISSGAIYDINGQNITLTTLSNNGSFQLQGGETTTAITNFDTAHGMVIYNGSGTYSGLKLGNTYNNLEFNGTGTWTLQSSLSCVDLTVLNGTPNIQDYQVNISGNLAITGGTFAQDDSGSNYMILTGSGKTVNIPLITYNPRRLKITGSYSQVGHFRYGKTYTDPYGKLLIDGGSLVTNGTKNFYGFLATSDGIKIINGGDISGASPWYLYITADTTLPGFSDTASGTIYLYGNYTYTLGGNLNVPNQSIGSYGTASSTLHTSTYNVTAVSLILGQLDTAYKMYVDFGSGTHTFSGNILRNATNTSTLHTINFGSSTVSVGGNIDFTGITVTSDSSTVILNGSAAQSITSSNGSSTQSLNNLTITNASTSGVTFVDSATVSGTFSDSTASSKITFNSGSTYAFNAISINGQAEGTRITLTSSTGGSAWNLNITASSPTASYVSVKDSNANKDIDATTGGYDATGNTHWLFPVTGITLSGTVYTAEDKLSNIGANKTIALSVNGAAATTVETTSGGAFSFSSVTIAANQTAAVFISGETEKGSLITQAADNSTNITGLELFTGNVVLTHQTAGPMTNTLLATADNVSDSDLRVSVDGSSIATFTSTMWVPTGKTYTPGAAVVATSVNIDGTFTASSNDLTVSGSWDANSGTFSTSGTVTFNASSGTASIGSGGQSFNNLVINDNAGSATFQITTAIDINGTFTLTDGVLDLDNNDPTVNIAGNIAINGGSITKSSANSLVILDGDLTYDDNVGAVNFGDIQVGTSPDTTDLSSDWTCDSLTIASGDRVNTNGYEITSAGDITISATATLDATDDVEGDGTIITLAGNWSNSGTFTASTSYVVVTGASSSIGSSNFNNLTLQNSTAASHTVMPTGNLTIAGNLSVETSNTGSLAVDAATNDPKITLSGNLSFTKSSSGTLSLSMGDGTWTISGNADFRNSSLSSNNSTLVMNGSLKTIHGTGIQLHNVTISDNIYTDDHYTGSGISIDGTLLIDADKTIYITAGQILHMKAGSSTTINGAISYTGGSANIEFIDSAGANVSAGGHIYTHVYFTAQNADVTVPARAYEAIAYLQNTDSTNADHTITLGTASSQSISIWQTMYVRAQYGGNLTVDASVYNPSVDPSSIQCDGSGSGTEYLKLGNGTWRTYGSDITFAAGTDTVIPGNSTFIARYSGTFNPNGQKLHDFTFSTSNPHTITLAGDLTVDGNMSIETSWELATFDNSVNNKNITIVGNLSYSGPANKGAIKMGTGSWKVGGNVDFANIAVTPSTSTLELNGFGSQTLTSAGQSLYNVTVSNASTAGVTFADSATVTGTFTDTTASSKLTFHALSTYAFANININGGASGTKITMVSSDPLNVDLPSRQWYFNVSQTSPQASYVNVTDSDASGGNGITPISSTDGGNNENWLFNSAPVNDSLTFSNPYSGTSKTAVADDTTVWDFQAKVSDVDGASNINKVELHLANGSDSTQPYDSLKFRWDESTDSFSEVADTQDSATIVSTSADSNSSGNQWTLDFKIKLNYNFLAKDTDYAIELVTIDDASATDTDNYASIYNVAQLFLSISVDNSTLNFESLLPGSVITETTTTTVTCNHPNGYSLSVSDGVAGAYSALLHSDLVTRIADYLGTISTPTSWSGTGLGITVYSATNKDTKWGTGTTEGDLNNKYAGIPETATIISTKTGSPTSSDQTKIGYKIVVPNDQKTGNYLGTVTYTATGALN